MKFTALINGELNRLGKPSIEGIRYEQFCLVEYKNQIKIVEGKREIAVVETYQQAKELIDTINSGC